MLPDPFADSTDLEVLEVLNVERITLFDLSEGVLPMAKKPSDPETDRSTEPAHDTPPPAATAGDLIPPPTTDAPPVDAAPSDAPPADAPPPKRYEIVGARPVPRPDEAVVEVLDTNREVVSYALVQDFEQKSYRLTLGGKLYHHCSTSVDGVWQFAPES